jgi:hypothetical protein
MLAIRVRQPDAGDDIRIECIDAVAKRAEDVVKGSAVDDQPERFADESRPANRECVAKGTSGSVTATNQPYASPATSPISETRGCENASEESEA